MGSNSRNDARFASVHGGAFNSQGQRLSSMWYGCCLALLCRERIHSPSRRNFRSLTTKLSDPRRFQSCLLLSLQFPASSCQRITCHAILTQQSCRNSKSPPPRLVSASMCEVMMCCTAQYCTALTTHTGRESQPNCPHSLLSQPGKRTAHRPQRAS